MSDFLDQRLRESFMDLRDDLQVEIEPPGTDAVRTSVSRRRRIRTAATACGLALAFVGAWAVLRPVSPTTPASTPTNPPAPAEYSESLTEAFNRVGYWSARYLGLGGHQEAFWWANTISVPMGPRLYDFPKSRTGGTFLITAACAGGGSITVNWQTQDASGDLQASCEADDGAVTDEIAITRAGLELSVSVLGDESVAYGGAFVVALDDARSIAAMSALDPPDWTVPVLAGGTGTSYDAWDPATGDTGFAGPGRYRLELVCVGDGRISASLSGDDTASDELDCTAGGARLDLESTATGGIDTSIVEQGEVGYAYLIYKVG